jgi:hypothetical protein
MLNNAQGQSRQRADIHLVWLDVALGRDMSALVGGHLPRWSLRERHNRWRGGRGTNALAVVSTSQPDPVLVGFARCFESDAKPVDLLPALI